MLGLPQTQAQAAAATPAGAGPGFSFHDLLSIINPLQHLPVIGTLYRAVTGDTIGTPEKIAGDTLYGGLWGAVASIADAAFEESPARCRRHGAGAFSPAAMTASPWPLRPTLRLRLCLHSGGACRHRLQLSRPERSPGPERRGQRTEPARFAGLSEIHDPASGPVEYGACHRAVVILIAWI